MRVAAPLVALLTALFVGNQIAYADEQLEFDDEAGCSIDCHWFCNTW
jgi:hypothetical protein